MTKVAKLAAFMIILILAFVKLAPFKMSKETTSLRFKHMPLLSIYIHSGPSLIEGRQRQRKHCFHSYRKHNITSTFVVARPSFDDRPHNAHAQGQHGTTKEHALSEMLLNESNQYNDMLLLQHRDYYRDMTDKMLAYFKYDYTHVNSKYVFKTDDEYCLNIPNVLKVLETHKKSSNELYVGYYMFKGTEYERMKGPHGEIARFASGAALGISRGLVENIVNTNWAHSSLYHIYGTSSDDANLGKWIVYAQQTNKIETDYVVDDIKYTIV